MLLERLRSVPSVSGPGVGLLGVHVRRERHRALEELPRLRPVAEGCVELPEGVQHVRIARRHLPRGQGVAGEF